VEIATFIGQDRPVAAERFLTAAERTFAQLARMPRVGRVYHAEHPTLGEIHSVRVRGFANYLIFYRLVEGDIEVLRVVHGARDIPMLLSEGELGDTLS
jgi:toxin ParE1/3/4